MHSYLLTLSMYTQTSCIIVLLMTLNISLGEDSDDFRPILDRASASLWAGKGKSKYSRNSRNSKKRKVDNETLNIQTPPKAKKSKDEKKPPVEEVYPDNPLIAIE